MTTSRVVARVIVGMLLAGLLTGCGTNWASSTYDPRRSCTSFGQIYSESDGTCRGGGA